MSWRQLLDDRRVQRHQTTIEELDGLRRVVERDLGDASLSALSPDRRFATAYNAALQLTTMAIACAGYRVLGRAHHQTTIEALELAMGQDERDWGAYLDICRRKQNVVDYDTADVATLSEADELVTGTLAFRDRVETWIRRQRPDLAVKDGSP